MDHHPVCGEPLGDLPVSAPPIGGGIAGEVHARRACLAREPAQDVRGAPAEDPQPGPAFRECHGQRGHALTHEPHPVRRGPPARQERVIEHEDVGGFWVLEAADLGEALAWGRKAAFACRAPVEVRPFH